MRSIVVVGGSLGGVSAVDALRAEGFDGAVTLVGEEHHHPYARPPLSKAILAGVDAPESIELARFDEDVDVRLGTRAVGLDIRRREVTLADGGTLCFDGLVIATGAHAISLARPGQSGEHVLRTLDDCLALRDALARGRSVAIVGGGLLGMEIASTCSARDMDVTVVDREPPLRRVLGHQLADMVVAAARRVGVRFVVQPGDSCLIGDPVSAVQTPGGERVEADVVCVAVGDRPNVQWLTNSGLAIDRALIVDRSCQAAPGIVAAGDVCAVRDGRSTVRRPHWGNAIDQGRRAAKTLLQGPTEVSEPVPYFWTEQFGLEIKLCGEPPHNRPLEVVDGSIDEREAVVRWSGDGRPSGAATVNRRMPIPRLKRLAQAQAQHRSIQIPA